MLRRTFLLGGGAALALRVQSAPPPPSVKFAEGYENKLGDLKLRNLPELHLHPPKSLVKRRLWPEWSPDERKDLGNAYRRLIDDAKGDARRGKGLLHAAWWHGHFCCDHPNDDLPDGASNQDIHYTWD